MPKTKKATKHDGKSSSMKIKTFRAKTLRDALAMVRAEFGDGAAVLHSREVNAGPIARLLRGAAVEVAATPDHSPLAEQAARTGAVAVAPPKPAKAKPVPRNRVADQLDELGGLVEALPKRTTETQPTEADGDAYLAEYGRLLEGDLAPALAKRLIAAAKQAGDTEGLRGISSIVKRLFEQHLRVSGPIRVDQPGCRVVALVGPTGVGKTTTLAKLAANFRLQERARVGLITVDTYRVAAVDQLRTYAEIIDLPMEVVSTPEEMQAAVAKLADLDLVLIDTAGRSPRDATHLEELRRMLEAASPHETHLVTSVTSTARGIEDAIERFGTVSPTALLLTKLDEAPSLGHAAEPVIKSQLPISYLTDGQSVPEDIRGAQAESLAGLLLSGGRS